MTDKTLYRYIDENGHLTVSPNKPDAEYATSHRLIADEGKDLINAEGDRVPCIDTDNPDAWSEVEQLPDEEMEGGEDVG